MTGPVERTLAAPVAPVAPDAIPAAALPLDSYNRTLLDNVHPSDWINPTPQHRYDLVVVGAGTGGLVTAAIAVALGARVAMVERQLMGGDCLNVGCVPSKAVLRAARSWQAAREAAERFGGPDAEGEGDFAVVMQRMRALRAGISAHDSAARFRELGVDVFIGDGKFLGPDRLQVADATLRFRRAVIATGARAALPPVPGLEEAECLTNETIFSLTELPPRLVVIGGGAIGCELAQAFARFGSRVLILELGGRLLPKDDPDAAGVVHAALVREGVEIALGAEVLQAGRNGAERRVRYRWKGEEHEVVADAILVAAGRAPNVEGLGLEVALVRHGPGGVEVDERLRTSSPNIYAVGDITGLHAFTHVADAHARMVVQNALFFGRRKHTDLAIPWCTYTSPELAHVGISHAEAARRGDVETITVPFAEVDRAKLDGATEGFVRVHLARGSDRILGATIVGEHAGELITQFTTAMVAGVGLGRLGDAIYPYPTLAEAVRKTADAYRRQRLTPRVKKAFELWFRFMGR